ncbi:MAG: hypothetical protein IOD12_03605 [Silvanigrellales bacterium]|nr:hypothetical protein [Silvanigrellales bacterium]
MTSRQRLPSFFSTPLATAVFPCLLGLAGLTYFIEMARVGEELFSNAGVFDDDLFVAFLQEVAQFAWPWSSERGEAPSATVPGLAFVSWLAWPFAPMAGIAACVSLFVAAWFGTMRIASLSALLGAACVTVLHFRNPLLSNSSDVLLGQLFLLAGFLLSARTSSSWTLERGFSHERFLLACFGALVYVGSVMLKFRSDHWWPEGSALRRALQTDDIVTPLGKHVVPALRSLLGEAGSEGVLRTLSFVTLGVEFLAPLALVFLGARKFKCASALSVLPKLPALVLVGLHVGILLLLDIGPFPLVCLALWVPFLFSVQQTEKTQADEKTSATKSPFGFAYAFLGLCAVSLAGTLFFPERTSQGRIHFFLYMSNLKQNWSMFSPAPTHSTTYEALVTDAQGIEGPLEQGHVLGLPAFAGYGWKVYWDVFWANPWRASRGRGTEDSFGLKSEMGHNLALRVCREVPLGALRVVVFAKRVPHGETRFEKQLIARASCPQDAFE